ncbi:gag-protease polyprotein, partial [Trifolium medium]|nr:gag-protease polyprotein [Trifolium medium]
MDKEGGKISRPPLLIGPENYDYWKAKMMVFLKSIDSRTWKAVENGWEPPVVIDKDGKKTSEIKPTKDYSKDEDDLALGNSKALNAIFNGVDINMFRLVKRCTVAKHAWEILRKAHEGTNKVKLSKLQMLRTNFENLSMKEEETIHDFHMNILEFANSFDALGEPISDEKLVSKILRSLPNRFDMKVTAIEESQDLPLPPTLEKMKNQTNDQRRARSDEKTSQSEGVQCQECEGYGHIKAECPTFLKRQKKSLAITWSDEDDSEEETESGSAKHVNALTGLCESDAESCDETSYEELLTTYKDLFIRSNEVYKALEKQKKVNCQLQAEKNECLVTIDTLNKEIEKLNGDLEHARKQVRVYGSGEEKFQAMLLKQSAGKKPIGFDYEIVDQQMGYNKATISTPIEKTFPVSAGFLPPHPPTHQGTDTWLKPKPKPPAQTGSMPQHPPPHRNNWSRPKSRRRNWRCHYCGRKGHIRPYCYKLYGYPKNFRSPAPNPENVKTKKEWKEKENDVCLIAHSSLRASSRQDWYFDSGCSRHMTGVEGYLANLKSYA